MWFWVWPFSVFQVFLKENLKFLDFLPWTAFVLRSSLLVASAVAAALTPIFLFLTIINMNSSDSLRVRVALSLLHALWWSLLITLLGSVACVALFTPPALLADVALKNPQAATKVALPATGLLLVAIITSVCVRKRRNANNNNKKLHPK